MCGRSWFARVPAALIGVALIRTASHGSTGWLSRPRVSQRIVRFVAMRGIPLPMRNLAAPSTGAPLANLFPSQEIQLVPETLSLNVFRAFRHCSLEPPCRSPNTGSIAVLQWSCPTIWRSAGNAIDQKLPYEKLEFVFGRPRSSSGRTQSHRSCV